MIRLISSLTVVLWSLLIPAAWGDSDFRFNGVHRIVAVPDVHGAYDELVSILRETTVIDEAQHWRGGETHLVSLGDLLDRGPDSRKVLDLLMRLELEARGAGGAVHLVLGNHEVMNIVGDLRYVSGAEYAAFGGNEDNGLREQAWQLIRNQEPDALRAEFDSQVPAGYFAKREAFSVSGKYGAWLLAKPFLIVINDSAFVHGGLPPLVAELGLEGTNQRLHSELADYLRTWSAIQDELRLTRPTEFVDRPDAVARRGAEQQSTTLREMQEEDLFTSKSPIWFRGQALCYPYTEAENLDAALAALGVARVVAGHTPTPTRRVVSRFNGRVILLDTGMLRSYFQGSPAALVFEGGQWTVAYSNHPAQRLQPEVPPRAVGPRPVGLDDDALEQWLEQADIVETEKIDTGITHPHRVTLRKDGVELHAVFKDLSTADGDSSDRFEYELAAYKLDRLLDLNMIPVTVKRTVKDHRGILQFWVEGSINVRKMLEQKRQPAGECAVGPQYNLMNVFDVLIDNTDRTQENALFTQDWMLVLIDHTRAFRTDSGKPRLLYRGELKVPPALAERLKTLNREMLQQTLGPYLKKRQIDSLLKRRDLLLKDYAARSGPGEHVTR
jgi:Calcineurin-like phosphoesterase